jgi:hypothetical protein
MTKVSDTVHCLGALKALHCEEWNCLQVGKDVGLTVWRLLERGCHCHWARDSKDRGKVGLWRIAVLINTDDGQCPKYWSSSVENVFRLLNLGCYVLKEKRGINKERVLKFPLCEFICTSLICINK